MFQRLGVRISAPYTGWTFFHIYLLKKCNDVCLIRPKINDKRGWGWPIFKKKHESAILLWAIWYLQPSLNSSLVERYIKLISA